MSALHDEELYPDYQILQEKYFLCYRTFKFTVKLSAQTPASASDSGQ